MSVIDQLVSASRKYSQSRPPRLLPLPPARRVSVVTCMDARMELLARSALLEPGTPIQGFIYDVHSGQLHDVWQPAHAGTGG